MSDVRQLPLFPALPSSPDDLNPHTALRDTIMLFQAHLRKEGKSEHTVKAFTSDLQLLAYYTREETAIGRYTTNTLNHFLNWMEHERGVPCSRKTYARRVTALKVFFKWLHAIGAIPNDPARSVLQRSGPAPLPTVLTPYDVEDAITFARTMRKGEERDTRPELLFRLILDTGIKKGEAMQLTPQSIDHANPSKPILTIKQKNSRNIYKERKIDLNPEWITLLDAYLEQYHPQDSIFDCTARNLEYILTDIGQGAGIPVKISFEMLRWTCAVRDYRAGIDADIIRQKLGLSRISWQETGAKIERLVELQLAQDAG